MKTPHDLAADYLMNRIDWERSKSIVYAERTFRLDRMRRFLELLDHPQEALQVVHVAGTKGKGSTTAMLAAILRAAGLKTGEFTSPHLDRIEERFVIDGRPCPGETFAELIDQVRPAIDVVDREMPGDGPTYFEIATAVALLHFAHSKVDIAVLEVGLGGRLDSTNVCRPRVSVITSISMDHTVQLGSTLSKIASEKAGIIKPGVPVVSGVLVAEAQEVIRQTCREHGSKLIELDTDFSATVSGRACPRDRTEVSREQFDYHESAGTSCQSGSDPAANEYLNIELGMLGRHQARNAAVAIAAVHELRRQGWTIDEAAIRQGLATARCPARVEVFDLQPRVVIDAAHNGASIESLIETLDRSIPARHRHLLFATTLEKDLSAMLGPIVRAFDRIVFTRYTINPRAVDPAVLLDMARDLAGPESEAILEAADEPVRAFRQLQSEASPDDLVCVTGSFFIAAEIRRLLVPH